VDRTAVFVDAGYLFASGSKLVAGSKLTRSQLHLDHERVLALLASLAGELTGLPLLRMYWYDGASVGPSATHVALAYRPQVKLRLGLVNPEGGQEGVDELLAHDLLTLSRNRSIADAVVLTGDDDLRAAVEEAQSPARENQAAALVQASDGVRELSEGEVRGFLSRRAS
jgi:hypothetical protein